MLTSHNSHRHTHLPNANLGLSDAARHDELFRVGDRSAVQVPLVVATSRADQNRKEDFLLVVLAAGTTMTYFKVGQYMYKSCTVLV